MAEEQEEYMTVEDNDMNGVKDGSLSKLTPEDLIHYGSVANRTIDTEWVTTGVKNRDTPARMIDSVFPMATSSAAFTYVLLTPEPFMSPYLIIILGYIIGVVIAKIISSRWRVKNKELVVQEGTTLKERNEEVVNRLFPERPEPAVGAPDNRAGEAAALVWMSANVGGVDIYSGTPDEAALRVKEWAKNKLYAKEQQEGNCFSGHSNFCRHRYPEIFRALFPKS